MATEAAVRLEDLTPGARLDGVVPGEPVEAVGVRWVGSDTVELTFKRRDGVITQQVLFRADEVRISAAPHTGRPFDAPAADFRLVAEAQRIRLAGLHDPMLAVASSDVRPLPHQIRAVYGEMLPRRPLRFLLADDPGAGKTIMAGLLVKELRLREDVRRCLVVAPGGLVEQWQDELWLKFGLDFAILQAGAADAGVGQPIFDTHPLLIARMDQLSRNDELLSQLGESEWDLVVVDEAHRMSAHWFGGKLERSKRFLLGQLLGGVTRHLLLMTATPHSGKDEDFQLFLSLLDRDRFEGRVRRGAAPVDTRDVMRRMIKEDLLTFEGRPLFPERVAQTVPYELSPQETELYDEVTTYVREEMNRAERLDGKRRNTVGFALTVLQRRLASSPAAIHESLRRRAARLERRRTDLVNGVGVVEEIPESLDLDGDDFSAEEVEFVEEELVDAATAARTVEELDAELAVLGRLVVLAGSVRGLDTDRKWVELRSILTGDVLVADDRGLPRKLIVFTEHRDTLDYLHRKIAGVVGRADAVAAIHGGVRRKDRRTITEEFTHNRDCRVLLATDAAGEGLNLQAAHLVVNYDLPWNPNRIEQRFGRVHRIGQEETCRLWNLVATNTREGAVFLRLLEKVEEQRKAYGGRVFDVLGEAFGETPLRELLVEAIRYGEQPEVRARMEQIVDAQAGEGLAELLDQEALARESMADLDVAGLRRQMEEARARRLQPHFVEQAFLEAFRRQGGRLSRREAGRFEIGNVPAGIRAAARGPVATRYDRITFEIERIEGEGLTRAELVAPGHPLHDAVLDELLRSHADVLERGSVLVSAAVDAPSLLVGVVEEIVDATGATISKRFGYAYVGADGLARDAGPAPYLDCVAAPSSALAQLPWLATVEQGALDWWTAHRLQEWLSEVRAPRLADLARTRSRVTQRMGEEINRLAAESLAASQKERAGQRVRASSESLDRKVAELEVRLARRLELLDKEEQLSSVPPRVVAAAVVLPVSAAAELPATAPLRAKSTEEVERRAVDAVLAAEVALGRSPVEMVHNNPGYDIESSRGEDPLLFIEVKGRLAGAEDFYVTHTEVRHGQNAVPNYRLALVSVDPRGAAHDEIRYLDNPFDDLRLGSFDVEGIRGHWARTWSKGRDPF